MILCKDCKNCVVKLDKVRCAALQWFDFKGEEKIISYLNKNNQLFGINSRFGKNNPMNIFDCKSYESMEE